MGWLHRFGLVTQVLVGLIGTSVSAQVPVVSAQDSSKNQVYAASSTGGTFKRAPRVAILSFVGKGIEEQDLSALTNRFESSLMSTDSFVILERRNVDKILQEQGFQQSGACDNSECSVQIGQLLSVEGIFTGELVKIDKIWSFSVKRTDVANGRTVFSHALDIEGDFGDVVRGGAMEMAQFASGRRMATEPRIHLQAKGRPVWHWLLGGSVLVGAITTAVVLSQGNGSQTQEATATREVSVQLEVGE